MDFEVSVEGDRPDNHTRSPPKSRKGRGPKRTRLRHQEPSLFVERDGSDTDSGSEWDGSQTTDEPSSEDEEDQNVKRQSASSGLSKPKTAQAKKMNPKQYFASKLHRWQQGGHQVQSRGAGHQDPAGETNPDVIEGMTAQNEMSNSFGNHHQNTAAECFPSSEDDAPPKTNDEMIRHLRAKGRTIPANTPEYRQYQADVNNLEDAMRCFGYNATKPKDGGWRFREMMTSLRPAQLVGVRWMMERECMPDSPSGGILADTMGTGKTIMAVACSLGNRPDKEELRRFSNATLVVVTGSTDASRWVSEIKEHCKAKWFEDTILYKTDGTVSKKFVSQAIFVIATLQQVRDDFDGKVRDSRGTGPNMKRRRQRTKKSNSRGPLFRVKWYRVILDEAHQITNHTTKAYHACTALRGKHRWALTATPISNTAKEFFPLLKFVGCEGMDIRRRFVREYMEKGENKVNQKFMDLISRAMLRRKRDHIFLGKPLNEIHEYEVHDIRVGMSKEEQILASATNAHFSKTGRTTKTKCSTTGINVGGSDLIKRRQLVSYWPGLDTLFRQEFTLQEIALLRDQLKEMGSEEPLLDQTLANLAEEGAMDRYAAGIERVRHRQSAVHGGRSNMQWAFDLIYYEKKARRWSKCVVCDESLQDLSVVPMLLKECEHGYCLTCFDTANRKKTGEKVYADCEGPGCDKPMTADPDFETLAHIVFDAKLKKFQEPGRDGRNQRIKLDHENGALLLASAMYKDKYPLPQSTKLTVAMAVLETWRLEAPQDKIVVFVQFLQTAKALGLMLNDAGIGFVYLVGNAGPESKARAIEYFWADREEAEEQGRPMCHVMVSTLQAGSQGNNLQVANRAIIVDPWWNNSVEEQAFGRVTRIGQKKKCHFVRILATGGIDDKVTKLQVQKAVEINHALQTDSNSGDGFNRDLTTSGIADIITDGPQDSEEESESD